MRTQRLQNDRLPIFDGKVLKFLKRHVEVNLNVVVAADANGFDELRNDHFLCLKGAGVEQICPCEQSVVFLPQILRRSQQRLIFCHGVTLETAARMAEAEAVGVLIVVS